MRLSRRDALRLSLPLALSPASVWTSVPAHAAEDAQDADEALRHATESTNGWSSGTKVVSGAEDGSNIKAIAWTVPAAQNLASLNYDLGNDHAPLLAHAARLRFRYRVEGSAPETLHLKIIAPPLAGGFQAMYPLTIPPPGEWREANIAVQSYSDVWGTENAPQKTGASLVWRVGKAAGIPLALLIADLRLEPLTVGASVNTSTTGNTGENGAKAKIKIVPLVTAERMRAATTHPRLIFAASDLPAIRARTRTTDSGRAYLAALTNRCDAGLAKTIELPDRGSQWWHWYACPKHGTRLRTEGPHRHVCPTGGEVYSGYPYDDVVLANVHNAYSDQIRDLGMLYALTGNAKYAQRARAILLAYADKYLTYPLHDINGKPNVGGGRVGPQTLDESTWLIPVAQGCDLIWDILSPGDIETLKTKLFYPAAVEVIQKHRMPIHNIQCWKNSAMGLTGLLFGDADLFGDAVDNPDRGLQAQLARGITEDGPWYEGAWGYHFYTMSALEPLAEATRNVGIDVYRGPSGDRYRNFYLAPVVMAMPDGRLPAFNDSGTATANGNALYEIAFARWNDPRLAAPLQGTKRDSLPALIAGSSVLPVDATTPLQSVNFTDSGYAILRGGSGQNAAYVALKYGPHGGGHGHPDKLNFVFYASGRVQADDPGTTAYGVPIEAGWYKSTLAHNTLVVDEANQKPAAGTCLEYRAGNGWAAVLADAGPIYDGIRFQRAVFLIGAETLVVLDLAKATDGKPHTFDFAFHPSGTWQGADAAAPLDQPKKPGYEYLREMRPALLPAAGATFAVQPDARLIIAATLPTGSAPPTLLRGTGVGKNSEDRVPCILVRFAGAVSAANAVLLASGKSVESARLTRVALPDSGKEALAARLEVSGKRFLLIANPEGGALRVGNDYTGRDKLATVAL